MASRGLAKFKSIISTRSRNKDAHPGTVDAAPKRRSPQEMQKIRAEQARTLQEKEQNDTSNIKAAAEVEDQLRREDIERRASNHPSHASGQQPYRPDHPKPTDPYEEGDSEVTEDEYVPCKGPSDKDDGESEVDEDEEEPDSQPKAKKAKKPKLGRADVKAVRQVTATISSIPPRTDAGKRKAQESDEPQQAKKKTKNTNQRPYGLLKGWDSSRKPIASSSNARDSALPSEDDSMVRPGGIINDLETDDIERDSLELRGSSKKILPNPIKITSSVPTAQLTKKALRGGSRKWKLSHLPADTQDLFSDTLVPFAKIKAGTLAPWDGLEPSQIQDLVDVVFPGEGHVVATDDSEDVWCGLVTYRLSNWRNAFLSHASEAVSRYIDANKDMFPNGKKDIAEFIELYLEIQGTPPTAPFHWRDWIVDDETGRVIKKGRFQNQLIMYTLAHAHFTEYDEIPDPRNLEDGDLPTGALILATQAARTPSFDLVEHALKSWSSGSCVEDKSPKGHFSGDRYADKTERKQGKDGRMKEIVTKRAGKHVPTVKSLRQEQWVTIFETVTKILDGSKKKKKNRSKSISSRASSEVFEVEEDVPDYIVVSDED